MDEMSAVLNGLQPVSHVKRSKFPIVWHGAIVDTIRNIKQNNRLIKLINVPLFKDMSFYQLAFKIVDETKKLVDKQAELQAICDKSSEEYYNNTIMIVRSSERCFRAWYEYSPDMAVEEIQKDANLYNTVHAIYDEFQRMNLPEELRNYVIANSNLESGKSGCLGLLLLFLIPSFISLIGLSVYGLSQVI